ncbi:aminotransferase class III-fold pyridoxal phosphate-dependent enzyme [Rhizobium terrae]|uniref:aminotransferase class III-fold pyridoxal phosphate-dependent enzyme n=1 Tax=Rhizobium terrae TaxID=2171756 RepID=UPI000E3C732E|nr:aminotransferase class III-fold pyridoxal phosphate-dependent enzyme [Rhizobium terrae]
MSDLSPELTEPPSTDVPIDAIEEILREQYGLSGQIFPIEGRQNPYFLIDNGHMRYLLKVAPADGPVEEITAEHALMRHILRSPDGPRVPEPVATRDGRDMVTLALGGEERLIRLLTFIDGTSPPADERLSDHAIAAFGSISASLARSVEDFQDPILDREPEDDLRKAGPQTVALLSAVTDQQIRDGIAKAMVTALRRIQPLAPALRIATAHHNLTADSVAGDLADGSWQPVGVTDFSGISKGWLVAGFANTCAYLLANRGGDPFSLLPAVRAYHKICPLNLAELEALWPLIVARTSILAAEAESRQVRSPDDPGVREETERRRALLEAAGSVSPALVFAAILDATGMVKPLPEINRLVPDLDPDTIRLVDLSVTSPLLYGGNWTDPENDWRMLARIASETGRAATRYGEYRLSKSVADPHRTPESFALHIDACVPAGSAAVAPFAGTLRSTGPRLVLSGRDLTLHVEGLECTLAEETELAAGDPLGGVAGAEGAIGGLRLRLCRDSDLVPPLFCTPDDAGTWSNLCPSPAILLGVDANAPPPAYPDTPAGDRSVHRWPVRGWKEYLFDATGRSALDLTGDAPLPGHGHPRIAAAAYRQRLLLKNAALGSPQAREPLLDRLKGHAPQGLNTVFLLRGRSDALHHALNLARAHTGRDEIVCFDASETTSTDDDSRLIHVDSLQSAKAAFDGGGKAGLLLADLLPPLEGFSNLPDAVSRNEGLMIVEETRTGWGRLGHHAWGFDAQGLKPDIVFAGLPGEEEIAVVFARETIAADCRPISALPSLTACAAATANLDIHEEEGLRENARLVGDGLRAMLQELAARHPAIRQIRGMGFFQVLDLNAGTPAEALRHRLAENGIFITIRDPAELMILPPLCFSEESATLLIRAIEKLLAEN